MRFGVHLSSKHCLDWANTGSGVVGILDGENQVYICFWIIIKSDIERLWLAQAPFSALFPNTVRPETRAILYDSILLYNTIYFRSPIEAHM